MATSIATQSANTSSYAFQYSHHRPYSQSNFTPPSSITPPGNNISPTNSHHPPKQIFPARHCGYVPAALRPTELPANSRRPLTPPRSTQSSFESQSTATARGSKSLPVSPLDDVSSFIAPFSHITKVASEEWDEELGKVTGQPTRSHWKPDSSASCCTSPICTTVFGFLARRHHCRRCGGIYCTSHSATTVPLDQEARFHPEGNHSRSCDNCSGDYLLWQFERKSRASSIVSAGAATPPAMYQGGHDMIGSNFLGIKPRTQPNNLFSNGQESVGNADWNWSTF